MQGKKALVLIICLSFFYALFFRVAVATDCSSIKDPINCNAQAPECKWVDDPHCEGFYKKQELGLTKEECEQKQDASWPICCEDLNTDDGIDCEPINNYFDCTQATGVGVCTWTCDTFSTPCTYSADCSDFDGDEQACKNTEGCTYFSGYCTPVELSITGVKVTPYETEAQVSWKTNIAATCALDYEPSSDGKKSLPLSTEFTAELTDLSPCTEYSYLISCSTDSTSAESSGSFKTEGCVEPLEIISPTANASVKDGEGIIEVSFKTNKDASCDVICTDEMGYSDVLSSEGTEHNASFNCLSPGTTYSVEISCSADEESDSWSTSVTISSASSGSEKSTTDPCESDSTPPAVWISPPESEVSGVQGPVYITIHCSDSESGCKEVCYKIVYNLSAIFKNWHCDSPGDSGIELKIKKSALIGYYGVDNCDNKTSKDLYKVIIDNSAPVTYYKGPEGEISDSAKIELICEDRPKRISNSGCSKTMYLLNKDSQEGSWQVYSSSIVLSEAGKYTIQYYSVDNAGNTEEIQQKSFEIISEEEPEPLEIVSGPSIEVSSSDAVITWTTSKSSSSFVFYGKTPSLGLSAGSNEETLTHKVTLSPLEPNTTYYFKVVSSTETESVESMVTSFKTEEELPTAIIVSDVNTDAREDCAEILWKTNVSAYCDLDYGTTLSYAYRVSDEEKTDKHEAHLYNLAPGTKYYFKITCYREEFFPVEKQGFFETLPTPEKIEEIEKNKEKRKEEGTAQLPEKEKSKIVRIDVLPKTKVQTEGKEFIFLALVVNPSEGLIYEWDFGDGFKEVADSRVTHVYYLENENITDFVVTLTVRDSNVILDKKEVSVTVRKAYFKAKLLEPYLKKTLSKKQTIPIKVAFFDLNNNLVPRDNILDCRIFLKGKRLQVRFSENNLLETTFDPKMRVSNTEFVLLKAKAYIAGTVREITTRFSLKFKPLQVKLASNPFANQKYYLGSKLGTVRLTFLLGENRYSPPLNVEAWLKTKNYKKELKVLQTYYAAYVDLDQYIGEEEQEGLYLVLKGEDRYGNKLNETIEIPIYRENPALNLEILKPKERKIALLDSLPIEAKIYSNQGLRGAVSIICDGIVNSEMVYDAKRDTYYFALILPADYDKNQLRCKLVAKSGNFMDIEYLNLSVLSDLQIEFIMPKEGLTFVSEPLTEMKIKINYVDGKPTKFDELVAELMVDNNVKEVVFKKYGNEYVAKLNTPLAFGEHTIKLNVKEPLSAEAQTYTTLIRGPSLAEILVTFLFILAMTLIIFSILRCILKIQDKRSRLIEKRKKIISLMKKLKVEYFKHHITEAEFKERYTRTKIKLNDVNKKLKNKEYLRFWKK
ncbi:MAG: fibronectin type III domain-containing protein [Candidatus Diapherotrites archaeon]|nr:fibronectin type III domain-containing protein [Candidatus Diapherotrites archaeon]